MFTGIIKAVGSIEKIEPQGGDLRLSVVAGDLPWNEFAVGESISINGVCLTAVEFLHNGFVADVSVETTNVTALANLAPGSKVNLEPSVSMGERLGGHLVSGHVDCVGQIKARNNVFRVCARKPVWEATLRARCSVTRRSAISAMISSISLNAAPAAVG